ncbi:aminotransferase class I/II-fold pyridoxal phosphate-dependent enzyme [Streptomyces sp. NPDC054766]|uniref:aminotransferase class I/II-fold pyridoxal phosphate-dependent enzyme n=1 Tax=Streptomyces rhizosphaerihabitans TaxID=1266770 RepID=UPI0021C03599|nr:aminotransferase class I/II-fold pyridoxal phosphate-dependent enzyme [Streptomyces rhizosphaerihabitans]MCT9008475.1 aminotransferase class I/II-fold pyridoxal phosphate-dependent enzyme [Streptomyces rhizosphaerihabitans]
MNLVRSAFARLRDLQLGIPTPPGLDPIQLHLGESRLEAMAVDVAPLAAAEGWTRYPQLGGTAELRTAYAGWLERRFGVREILSGGDLVVEPTPGTKQAVTVAVDRAVRQVRGGGEAAVVMPNPFYPTYHAAAVAAGARPVYYGLDGKDPGHVRDAVAAAGAPVAAILVCNPGNPGGEILPESFLQDVAKTAAASGALLIVDECYTDLFLGAAPPGYLSLVERRAVEPGRFLVLHSLSKRSGAPGLRSGFAAGDPQTVSDYAYYNRVCGVSTPLPVCAVAAQLWRDEAHVLRTRRALAGNWDLADAQLAEVPGYHRAEAGFFLWLPVEDDEATARHLWRESALSVMPGRYLGVAGSDGVHPGTGRLRIALVHEQPLMREALERLRRVMAAGAP